MYSGLRRAGLAFLIAVPVANGALRPPSAAHAAVRWSAPYAGRQLAVDAAAQRVLILADDGSVTTLNARTGAHLNTVAVGQPGSWGPGVVDEGLGHALFLLSDGQNGRIVLLDTHAGSVLTSTPLPAPAGSLVEDPRTQQVYVAGSDESGTVSIVDARSGQVTGTLRVGAAVAQIALDAPAGRLLAITAAGPAGASGGAIAGPGMLRIVDLGTNSVAASVPTGNSPRGLAVDPASGHAFVSNAADRTISVIDDRAGQALATVPAGGVPGAVLVDSAHARAYVLDPGTWQGAGNASLGGPLTIAGVVDVLDAGSGAVLRRIPVGLPARAMTLDSQAGLLFVATTYTTPVGARVQTPAALVGGIRVIRTGATPRRTSVYWPAGASPTLLAADRQHGRVYALSAGSTTQISGTVAGFVSMLDETGL